jgi:hypothetical protein
MTKDEDRADHRRERAAAPLTAEEAAPIIVEMATIADDGPTGRFFDREGLVAW